MNAITYWAASGRAALWILATALLATAALFVVVAIDDEPVKGSPGLGALMLAALAALVIGGAVTL